jgi:hypothetical protein
MHKALIFNKATQHTFEMTARTFERQVHGNPELGLSGNPELEEQLVLIDPDTANPLYFRGTHWRFGHEIEVSPSFALMPGYAINDHVFAQEKNTTKTINSALNEGKKILLSLNTDLSYRSLNFREMKSQGTQKLEKWMEENHGEYLSVSAKTTQSAIKAIHDVANHKSNPDINEAISALYRGGVMPFRNFYMGHRLQDFNALFNNLSKGHEGMQVGETRMVGFPRLMRFIAAKTTKEQKGARGVRGNSYWEKGDRQGLINQLVFSPPNNELEPDKNKKLQEIFNKVINHENGVYVMASPTISIGQNDNKTRWKQLRWIINDTDLQTANVHAPAPRND